jgi:hypothetical protein
VADAKAQAADAGFTDCELVGDPLVFATARPGFPEIYHALVTVSCSTDRDAASGIEL